MKTFQLKGGLDEFDKGNFVGDRRRLNQKIRQAFFSVTRKKDSILFPKTLSWFIGVLSKMNKKTLSQLREEFIKSVLPEYVLYLMQVLHFLGLPEPVRRFYLQFIQRLAEGKFSFQSQQLNDVTVDPALNRNIYQITDWTLPDASNQSANEEFLTIVFDRSKLETSLQGSLSEQSLAEVCQLVFTFYLMSLSKNPSSIKNTEPTFLVPLPDGMKIVHHVQATSGRFIVDFNQSKLIFTKTIILNFLNFFSNT